MKRWNIRLKFGIAVLSLFLIFGFILPHFYPNNPVEWSIYPKNMKPDIHHFFGTTGLGQDTFWLLAKSVQNSFIIGITVSFFATLIGVMMGIWAGFRGGFSDRAITLLTDSFIVIPALPILILLGSLFKGNAPIFFIALILILFNWPWPARQTRAMAMSISERDFISTAHFSG